MNEMNVVNLLNGVTTIISTLSLLLFVIFQNEQIKESEKNRILQFQPLPTIIKFEAKIEAPKVFREVPLETPTTKFLPSFLCIYTLEHDLVNIGNSPALSINLQPTVQIINNEGDIKEVKTLYENVDYLKEGEIKEKINFMYSYLGNELIESLINKNLNVWECKHDKIYTKINMSIIYKNVLGGIFKILQSYEIWSYVDDFEILKEWLSQLKNAELKYNKHIKDIKDTNNETEKKQIFDNIKNEFDAKNTVEKINLGIVPIPGTLEIKPLTEKEYKEIEKKIEYPRLLGLKKKTDTPT
jgi:hypothetical protein